MVIDPTERTVLLWPHESVGVLARIPPPYSKEFEYNGHKILAVQHGVDEAIALRELGLKVPSPILTHYNWSRSRAIKEPFHAQKETAAFFTLSKRAHCHNGLGTGKTLAGLWAYDYLRSCGLAHKLLVICTLSTMGPAWADSIKEHFPHLSSVVLFGTRAKRGQLLLLCYLS